MVLLLKLIGAINHDMFDVLRDIGYALTPISLIFIGYWMADNKAMWPLIMKIMMTCSVILAVIHLSKFVQNPTLLFADLKTVRTEAGSTGAPVVFALVLGLFQSRLGVGNLFPRALPAVVATPVLLASVILSYSRTDFMLAIILMLALGGVLGRLKFRSILVVSLIVMATAALVATTPEDEINTFRGKLRRSLTEINVDDYGDLKDIQSNWRGYETFRAVETYASGSLLQLAVGQGAGALVDLGFVMKLDTETYRYIPILHNGYAYILVKAGALGIICYGFFFLNAIRVALRNGSSRDREQVFLSRLLLGCVLSMVLTMYIVGGIAEIHDAEFTLLMGFLMQRLMQKRRKIRVRGEALNSVPRQIPEAVNPA